MYCEQEMELEQRYFKLLQSVAFMATEKSSLKLYNQEGDLILEYLEQKKEQLGCSFFVFGTSFSSSSKFFCVPLVFF